MLGTADSAGVHRCQWVVRAGASEACEGGLAFLNPYNLNPSCVKPSHEGKSSHRLYTGAKVWMTALEVPTLYTGDP